jgi:hypothetical protein
MVRDSRPKVASVSWNVVLFLLLAPESGKDWAKCPLKEKADVEGIWDVYGVQSWILLILEL